MGSAADASFGLIYYTTPLCFQCLTLKNLTAPFFSPRRQSVHNPSPSSPPSSLQPTPPRRLHKAEERVVFPAGLTAVCGSCGSGGPGHLSPGAASGRPRNAPSLRGRPLSPRHLGRKKETFFFYVPLKTKGCIWLPRWKYMHTCIVFFFFFFFIFQTKTLCHIPLMTTNTF